MAAEALPTRIAGAADEGAERPHRAGVAVLGPILSYPLPRVRHEIPEASAMHVEGVVDEGQVAGCERAYGLGVFRPRVLHQSHQEQRARVVVDAVAVVVAWHAEDGVLQHARLIGHYLEVAEVDLGKLGLPFRERLRLKDRPEPCGVLGPRTLEAP